MTSVEKKKSDLMKLPSALINLTLNCCLKRAGGSVALLVPVQPKGKKLAYFIYSGSVHLPDPCCHS